ARTVNGSAGNITIKSPQGITMDGGSSLSAGGSASLSWTTGALSANFASVTAQSNVSMTGANVDLEQTTKVSAGGSLSITSSGTILLAAGTEFTSGAKMSLTSLGDLSAGDSVKLIAGAALSVSVTGAASTLNIGAGSTLSAGTLEAGAPPSGPLVSA